VDSAARRLLTPAERLARNRERLRESARRMARAAAQAGRERARHLAALGTALAHLDPTRVLARGYSIVRDADGHVRTTSAGLAEGMDLDVMFSEGGAGVRVREPR